MELTLEELEALEPGSYTLLDLRSEQETAYGTIPGSVPANAAALPEGLPAEPGRIVLFCTRGKLSLETAERLRDEGFDACSLKGGWRGQKDTVSGVVQHSVQAVSCSNSAFRQSTAARSGVQVRA